MIVRRSALVPRPASHVFDVIEAAEQYPQFLPWCTGATIVSRDAVLVSADLRVQWGGMHFEMRTRNPKLRPTLMNIHLERGPFRRFEGEWRLTELSADACKVAFLLDYEFESRLMTSAAGPVFNRLGDTLLDAFVERALALPVIAASAEAGSLSLSPEREGVETMWTYAAAADAAVATRAAAEVLLAEPAALPSTAPANAPRLPPVDVPAGPASRETRS